MRFVFSRAPDANTRTPTCFALLDRPCGLAPVGVHKSDLVPFESDRLTLGSGEFLRLGQRPAILAIPLFPNAFDSRAFDLAITFQNHREITILKFFAHNR